MSDGNKKVTHRYKKSEATESFRFFQVCLTFYLPPDIKEFRILIQLESSSELTTKSSSESPQSCSVLK